MTLTVISSGPSPYARKVRVALAEKGIPFTLQTEVPWDHRTQTPKYNPLEKLPILIISPDANDGDSSKPQDAVYESHHIMEYIELKYADTGKKLAPSAAADVDGLLKAKRIEVVADGVADALILWIWESRRDEKVQSKDWSARQTRKVEGGLKAMAEWVDEAKGGYLVNGEFGLADIAVGSTLGFMNFRDPESQWKKTHPQLEKYWQMLESRPSFKETTPEPFEGGIKDAVV